MSINFPISEENFPKIFNSIIQIMDKQLEKEEIDIKKKIADIKEREILENVRIKMENLKLELKKIENEHEVKIKKLELIDNYLKNIIPLYFKIISEKNVNLEQLDNILDLLKETLIKI